MSLEHDPARDRTSRARPGRLPLLMKVDEVAAELSVSRRQVYNLIAAGKLERKKIGARASRITGASVMELAEANET